MEIRSNKHVSFVITVKLDRKFYFSVEKNFCSSKEERFQGQRQKEDTCTSLHATFVRSRIEGKRSSSEQN